jgi:N-acetylmuramoyl-L-alanine amidase
MSPNPISRVFYRGIFDVPEKIRMRHFFAAVILLVVSVFLSGSPMDARAGTTITLKNIPGSLKVIDGRIDIDSIVSAFSLRASVDIMGDRLDLVGDGGSCRLLLGSSLVLSRGLFAVLTEPFETVNGKMSVPLDFLTKGLPSVIGKTVVFDQEKQSLSMGPEGSGSFKGVGPDKLDRYASFIQRGQFEPEARENSPYGGLRVVVLDPGHGGRSDGARGSTGTLEKDLVLSVAQKLKNMLEEDLGIKVVLTRTADYYVGLKERTAIANNNRADLFLSIHANAAFRKEVRGYETYYLSFSASDLEASQLAQIENRALGVEGDAREAPLLEAILWDMAQLEFINESGKLAAQVQETLVESLKGRDRGVRQAPLAVLMGARMPATLVEIGFISNPAQEIKLNRDSHQDRITRALFDAIVEYDRNLIRGEVGDNRP